MKNKVLSILLVITLLLSFVAACAPDPSNMINPVQTKDGKKTDNLATGTKKEVVTTVDNNMTEPQTTTDTSTQPTTTTTTTERKVEEPQNVEGTPEFNQGVMIMNDRIMELFGMNDAGLNNYAQRINNLRAKLDESVNVFSMVCPTSSEFYTPESYHTGTHSQRDAINKIYNSLDQGIITVDAYNEILQHYDEYIYFKTDHHWTGLGAYYAYVAFCDAANLEAKPLSDYEEYDLGEFYGTLYSYGEGKKAVKADNVTIYRPKDYEATAWVYPDSVKEGGYQMHLFATTWNPDSNSKYLAFSGGDAPLMQITSQHKNGKKILVIKDSFAKAFIPHLANNYEYVYEIDPRHFTGSIPSFVEQEQIDDVLVTNYALAVGNSTWLSGFDEAISR